MRRDMITPAHWLPTDDGKDCVGAAWELLRFQPHETQEQIHRRLGQWPLVCKLRKERNDMRSIKEQLKAGDNVWCVIHEPNRVVLGKVVSIGIFSQEMRYLISPDDDKQDNVTILREHIFETKPDALHYLLDAEIEERGKVTEELKQVDERIGKLEGQLTTLKHHLSPKPPPAATPESP